MAHKNYSVANGFIVSQNGSGDFTTIQSAINATSGGFYTIYLDKGSYTEDLTITNNIVITSLDGSQGNVAGHYDSGVEIVGNITITPPAGSANVFIGNVCLQYTPASVLTVTGSNVARVTLENCNIQPSFNGGGITFNNSNSSSFININGGRIDLQSITSGYWTMSSPGSMVIRNCELANIAPSAVAADNSAGSVSLYYCTIAAPITSSGTGTNLMVDCQAASGVTITGTGVDSSNNLVQSNLTADGVVYATSTGALDSTSAGTAGQVLTSNGAGMAPTFQNGAYVGMTWTDQSGTFTATANNGYFITGASTPTLPASPSEGNVVSFILDAAATVTITGNTGQVIRIGGTVSAAAGTCESAARGNAISLVYRSTGTAWIAISSIGTWTIT